MYIFNVTKYSMLQSSQFYIELNVTNYFKTKFKLLKVINLTKYSILT